MQVTVDSGLLTIHAERHEKTKSNGRSEFRYGRFDRSVSLPPNADAEHITASYDSGVLTVTVPLTGARVAGKKIGISTGNKEIDSTATEKPHANGAGKGAIAK
jgi:HSP20 family protein